MVDASIGGRNGVLVEDCNVWEEWRLLCGYERGWALEKEGVVNNTDDWGFFGFFGLGVPVSITSEPCLIT